MSWWKNKCVLPASSASLFARTVRRAWFSRLPSPSFPEAPLSRKPINWLSCRFPKSHQVSWFATDIGVIPWWARSENGVEEEEGDLLRAGGALPDGRRSSARRGWGAVTVGRDGIEGLDLELLRYWLFSDPIGEDVRVDDEGAIAVALFCSLKII